MEEVEREIEIAKLKAGLEKSRTTNRYQLISTILGTFLVSVLGSYLLFIQNTAKNLQDYDGGHREFVSKFVEIAIDEDIERRQRLARYFAFVTLDETQKIRWEEYSHYIDTLIEENPKQIAALKKDLDTASGTERTELEARIRFLENQLSSSSERANIQIQSSKECVAQFETYPGRWSCIALRELNLGVKEVPGQGTNPRIRDYAEYAAPDSPFANEGDDIPWTGLFVAWVVAQSGIDKADLPKNPYHSGSWLDFGIEASTPRPGVIAIFSSRQPDSRASLIGFYDGEDDEAVFIIAGNVNNAVSRTRIPKNGSWAIEGCDFCVGEEMCITRQIIRSAKSAATL